MLLALVFGIFLMLIGLTAVAVVTVTSVHMTGGLLESVVSHDRSLVALFVSEELVSSDVGANGPSASRADELEASLASLTLKDEILRVDIRAADGTILVSSTAGQRGIKPSISADMRQALDGKPFTDVVAKSEITDLASKIPKADHFVLEYLPLLSDNDQTLAVFTVWRDAGPLLNRIGHAQRDVVLVTIAASLLLAGVLFAVFRAAQKRITRQQQLLLESERRDPLTGLLNHGAVVGFLAEQLEAVRGTDGRLGLALMDIDNFRLLNDTYGHEAADEVLVRVSDLVEREAVNGGHVARYGPDEFLLALTDAGVREVEAAVERVRHGLAEVDMQFGESEEAADHHQHRDLHLPRARGLGHRAAHRGRGGPARGEGAAATRCAWRASARRRARHRAHSTSCRGSSSRSTPRTDTPSGTPRTSPATRSSSPGGWASIRSSSARSTWPGCCTTSARSASPDTLLRKPSRLTAQEFDIFKQHVALGDAIVRDVPDVETVRAGIRHHHERWDGRGYLEGLERDEIPLLGRILAVADAFSAMTTTRPYRKAMDVQEALKRLGDAAGTQLQEELVKIFIEGIETAADAPLPGEPQTGLWVPTLKVA